MADYVSDYDIVINKPIEFVFDNMTCQRGCISWATGMRSAEKVIDQPFQVGSKHKHVFAFMGLTATSINTVVELKRPYEFGSVDDTSKILKYEAHYSFKETPEGGTHVHVTQKHHSEGNLVGHIATSMFVRRYRKQFEADLETLKELLEEGIVIQHQ
jgi:hypothetical protein